MIIIASFLICGALLAFGIAVLNILLADDDRSVIYLIISIVLVFWSFALVYSAGKNSVSGVMTDPIVVSK